LTFDFLTVCVISRHVTFVHVLKSLDYRFIHCGAFLRSLVTEHDF